MASKNPPKRRAVRPAAKPSNKTRQSARARSAKSPSASSAPKTKLALVIAALSAPKGATLAQLMALTGWQAHSVRGALSGALKKQRGLAVDSCKTDGERVYRIGGGK
jgi:hypothetical protein